MGRVHNVCYNLSGKTNIVRLLNSIYPWASAQRTHQYLSCHHKQFSTMIWSLNQGNNHITLTTAEYLTITSLILFRGCGEPGSLIFTDSAQKNEGALMRTGWGQGLWVSREITCSFHVVWYVDHCKALSSLLTCLLTSYHQLWEKKKWGGDNRRHICSPYSWILKISSSHNILKVHFYKNCESVVT